MSASKTAKSIPTIVLLTVFLVFVSGMALAAEKGSYLGVLPQDISVGMAKALGLEDENGVLINQVVKGGPAHEAGLQDGDVIIKFNGKALKSHSALTKTMRSLAPGEKVDVVVFRNGKTMPFEIELGKSKERKMVFINDDGGEQIKIMIDGMNIMQEERGFMGVVLDDINEQMGDFFGVKDGKGALVTSVTEDSAAEDAGLEAGDIIIKIEDEAIESAKDVHAALDGTEPEQKLEVEVIRKEKKITLRVTLGEVPEKQWFGHKGAMNSDNDFFIQSPKMLNHEIHAAPEFHKEMRVIYEDESELTEMREELEKMKKDLEKMKAELKKN